MCMNIYHEGAIIYTVDILSEWISDLWEYIGWAFEFIIMSGFHMSPKVGKELSVCVEIISDMRRIFLINGRKELADVGDMKTRFLLKIERALLIQLCSF
jgi:hypothetical protein